MDVGQLLIIGEDDKNTQQMELEALRLKVAQLEENVIRLQGKLIVMYDKEDLRLKGLS
jgi:hypothetical protein